jgi:hypothetical protein
VSQVSFASGPSEVAMTPDEFQHALACVEAMVLAGGEPAYWCGFKRGLQRAYHGRRFTSNTDHYAWLDFVRDVDAFVAELGRGYRAGLETVASGRRLDLDVLQSESAAADLHQAPLDGSGQGRAK